MCNSDSQCTDSLQAQAQEQQLLPWLVEGQTWCTSHHSQDNWSEISENERPVQNCWPQNSWPLSNGENLSSLTVISIGVGCQSPESVVRALERRNNNTGSSGLGNGIVIQFLKHARMELYWQQEGQETTLISSKQVAKAQLSTNVSSIKNGSG